MRNYLDTLIEDLARYTPNLLAALAVLVIGWILAILVSALVRSLLRRTSVDDKVAGWIAGKEGTPVNAELWGSRAAFYFIMLFVLVAFFEALQLTVVTDPLNSLLGTFLNYIPRLIAGGILALIAWVVAMVLKFGVGAGLDKIKLNERLGKVTAKEGETPPALSKTLADAVFWVVLLIFLPAILSALEMQGLLEPVNEMMTKFFAFLPNLIAAAITLAVGWFVARIVQRLVGSLLAGVGADQLAGRWGLDKALGKHRLSDVVGFVLFVIILVPVLITALDQLQMAAITAPASQMLEGILTALPSIVAAALILVVAWLIGRAICGLVENLLEGVGFNQVLVKLGLSKKVSTGKSSPAAIVGLLLMIAIMLAAGVAAAETLGFGRVAEIVHNFLEFAGQILLGLLLFGLGLLLAQVVYKILHASDSPRAHFLAWIARIAIVVLIGAMALRSTGVADSIVNLGFGALVCGLALAAAIAFGFGGRKAAAHQLQKWQSDAEKK